MLFNPLKVAYFVYSSSNDQQTVKDFCRRVRNITCKAETLHFPLGQRSWFKNERTSAEWKVTCRIWNNVWYLTVFFGKVGNLLINGDARLATMAKEMFL